MTYAKAPTVSSNLYEEAIHTLYASDVVYSMANMLNRTRSDDKERKIVLDTSKSHIPNLGRFLTESADLTEYNDGNGLSFYDIRTILEQNKDELEKAYDGYFYQFTYNQLKKMLSDGGHTGNGESAEKKVFLTHYRSIQQYVACVYGVFKDTINKNITIAFRGSQGSLSNGRDWRTNFNAVGVGLKTPDKVKDKLATINKRLAERVLVHKGFFDYLFDNSRMKDKQRYDMIVDDIREAINGEEGYRIYVTGHSLGGALATMFSAALAGSGSKFDDIPRPISCITWAAPFSGTEGYRLAIEQMEKDGLLRSLRINNDKDIVPTIPNFSFLCHRTMKHTGINLRLTDDDYRLQHSSLADFRTALRNSIFKPVWKLMYYHKLRTYDGRFTKFEDKLRALKVDDLYKDPTITSDEFRDEKTKSA